ncbi:MAG: NADH:flavin oxidoreductase [Methanosarcinaceae archaeon]|nr:NADH:flavin oxidoreductase [Methanosarcinaceae archaeon]
MPTSVWDPIKLGRLEIKNRFIRSATNEYMADLNGTPNERIEKMYEDLSKNDVGLIITGFAYVSKDGGKCDPGQLGLYSEEQIPNYRKLVDAAHKFGSKIAIQLAHGGAQSGKGETHFVPTKLLNGETELTTDKIHEIQNDFVKSAVFAKEAGFDAVELHLAHGFLLSNFISKYTNRRGDDYGGNTENRTRIISEIIEMIFEKTGKDFPVFVKMNATDCFEILQDEQLKKYDLSNGFLEIKEAIEIAKILKRSGVCAIEVSGGSSRVPNSFIKKGKFSGKNEGYFKEYAKQIKEKVDLPIISVGGFRSLPEIKKSIPKYADMIALSRPFIREPDLVSKFKSKENYKSKCISCNKCFHKNGIFCEQEKDSVFRY